MIAELLAEVAATLSTRSIGDTFRDWREDQHFDELAPEQKRTFVELVVAAILYDGVQSDRETAWLERRRSAGHEDELIDAAVAVVRAELPARSTDETFVAFAEARAKVLEEGDNRMNAFEAMAFFLLHGEPPRGSDSAEWALCQRLGTAFGMSEGKTNRCLAFASGRTTRTQL